MFEWKNEEERTNEQRNNKEKIKYRRTNTENIHREQNKEGDVKKKLMKYSKRNKMVKKIEIFRENKF